MRAQSFTKKHRLLAREDFRRVMDDAHQNSRTILRSSPYIIYCASGFTGAVPKLGMSVPKKVLKKSVDRNSVKRAIREFFRTHQSDIHCDIVVRLSEAPENFESESLMSPLEVLTNRNI